MSETMPLMNSTAIARTMTLSREQLAVVEFVDSGSGNLLVAALAGTGKTFLIIQCLTMMRGQVAIVAYGKDIAAEIKGKVAAAGHRGVDVSTFHALGARVLRNVFPDAKLEGFGKGQAGYLKFTRIAEELNIPAYLTSFVKKAMSMAMLHGFGVSGLASAKDQAGWQHLVSHYNIDSDIADDNVVIQLRGREALILEGLRFAYLALNLSKKIAHEVYSFDEMLWLPLILNAKMPTYDWICVDESQDTNPVRREMARRMMKRTTRMLFVGDENQAIFGFTGADSDSLDIIQQQFGCKVFPLTTTYRCGKAIVEHARQFVPAYQAADGNPEGSVEYIKEAEFNKRTLVPGRDAILCRNTKPLVKVCYSLIARGVAAHIEGKDIGRDLVSMISRWPAAKTIPALRDKMHEWLATEMAKMLLAKQEYKAEALADRVETIDAIINGMPKGSSVNDLRNQIDGMFSDTKDGEKAKTVALMTIHKAKGREFHTVYSWDAAKLMPSKRAVQDHEVRQEQCLMWVNATRAIHNHVEVST